MSLWVKLCGVRTHEDVQVAIESGADAVGVVLSPSPREVDLADAERLVAAASGLISTVAVFYRPGPGLVADISRRIPFDLFQTEPGSLPPSSANPTLPVVHDSPRLDADVDEARTLSTSGLILVEGGGKGGHGDPVDRHRLQSLDRLSDVVLAGGLTPINVRQVVKTIRPGGVDVSSGIEQARGVKDHVLMRSFVKAAREAEEEMAG